MKTVRPNPMTNGEMRDCASCCSFDDGFCNNGIIGPVTAGGCCEYHETQAEFNADVRAIRAFRVAIGLPPDGFNRGDGPTGQSEPE